MKYRGGWPRLEHLSADYARDYGTTTMCPCGLKARSTVLLYFPDLSVLMSPVCKHFRNGYVDRYRRRHKIL